MSGVPGAITAASGATGAGTAAGPAGARAERPPDRSRARPPGYDALDLVARSVLDGFPVRRVVTEAELAQLSGQPIQQVLAALTVLVGLRMVTVGRDGYRLARPATAG
jgi:hypothetical protein